MAAGSLGQRLRRFLEHACVLSPDGAGDPPILLRRDALVTRFTPWVGGTCASRRRLAAALRSNQAHLSSCERAQVGRAQSPDAHQGGQKREEDEEEDEDEDEEEEE
eukprot:5138316-Pyramimonas_sp.AAC.2